MSGQAREGGNAPLTGFSSGVSDGGRGEGLAVKLSVAVNVQSRLQVDHE